MASTRKTLNPMTEEPQAKTDITKNFMLAFMESDRASAEDVEWFFALISDPENRKLYKNSLDNTEYEDIDIPKVRAAFCRRFYPNIGKKKSKQSFTDRIAELRSKKSK